MKGKIVCCVALAVVTALGMGCSARKADVTTAADEMEMALKQRDEQIAKLESSIERMEGELDRKQTELKTQTEAAQRAEEAARAAERAARDSATQAGSQKTAMTTLAGSELLPPNAKPGECYARIFVPPTYRQETERVLSREASSRVEIVPAKYEWVEEKVLVKPASKKLVEVPATYDWVEEKILVEPAHTTWKKGRGPIEKVDNATGEIMCLVEVPATYKTVRKKVQKSPPTTKEIEIPAEYKTMRVQRVVSPPTERRIEIPAEYSTVTKNVLKTEGRMEWRPVLCQTNMTHDTIAQIQRALSRAGHSPGPIDGVYGPQTRAAVRSFQQAKRLPTGGLTMATLQALGINL